MKKFSAATLVEMVIVMVVSSILLAVVAQLIHLSLQTHRGKFLQSELLAQADLVFQRLQHELQASKSSKVRVENKVSAAILQFGDEESCVALICDRQQQQLTLYVSECERAQSLHDNNGEWPGHLLAHKLSYCQFQWDEKHSVLSMGLGMQDSSTERRLYKTFSLRE